MGADPPDAYEEYAQRYADPDDTEVANSHREFPPRQYIGWPAVQRLLPDVSGKRVLDAGCGDEETIEWLLERDATATGVDASRTTAEQAY